MEISRHVIEGLKLEGLSRAGTGTCIRLPDLGICFDVAQGLSFAIPSEVFLITHGHMDHAGGIPYLISQRALNSLKPGTFVMPEVLRAPMLEILKLWEGIEGFEYEFNLVGIKPGNVIEHKPQIIIEPFQTVHRVPSQGYIIKQKKKKLKSEFENLKGDELRSLRQQGREIEDVQFEDIFAFTGDTQIEFLDISPQAASARVLMMEVTYFDSKKSIAMAREWGHIHFEELVPRLESIQAQKIVLIHSSRRYSRLEINEILDRRLSEPLRKKVILF